jgi:hypothetical protein
MVSTQHTVHYAPGSNRRSYRPRVDGVARTPADIAPAAVLSDKQRLQIQMRLRRHYLAEDASALGSAGQATEPEHAGWTARLRFAFPLRLFTRLSLRDAR